MAKKFDYRNQHILEDFSFPANPRCHVHPGVKEWTDGVELETGTGQLIVGDTKYCPSCAQKHGLITKQTLDKLEEMQVGYQLEQMNQRKP